MAGTEKKIVQDCLNSVVLQFPQIFLEKVSCLVAGVVSQEVHRLPHPYSDCTNHNIEIDLLMAAIHKKLEKVPDKGSGILKRSYR